MNILQITPFFKPSWESGGVVRVVYELSKELNKNGHQITVFTTNRSVVPINVKPNRLTYIDGMRVYYFDNLRRFIPFLTIPVIPYFLPFIARKEIKNFDIIHMHEYRSLLSVIIYYYARKFNVPYIVQAHGSAFQKIGKEHMKIAFDKLIGNKILANSIKLIAVSNSEIKQYKLLNQDSSKIVKIPNGINTEILIDQKGNEQFRKKYCIPENYKIILYLGRLDKRKGIDFLISAFYKVKQFRDDVVLVIAGTKNRYFHVLYTQIQYLNINADVRFTGNLSEKEKINAYLAADILVYPSTFEIFGLVPFEAILCNTPVIVTDDCGCGDIINEAEAGLLVKYGDIDDLREKILYLLSNPEKGEIFVKNGKNYIRNNLNYCILGKQLEKLYFESILK